MSPDRYVTADLHLRGEASEPPWIGFRSLCRHVAGEGAPLYVLGDLFDYWVGPRQARLEGFRRILELIAATAAQAPVHILRGNRDFAIGAEIAAIPGVTLHGDDVEVPWAGRRALLSHGDLLLENDRAYQRMRRVLRTPLVRGGLRVLPLTVSLRLAGALRSRSTAAVARKPHEALAISFPRVRALFRDGGYDVIVAGHVHRPAVYVGELGGRRRRFLTLGAWGARGWVVRLGPEGTAELGRFPAGGTPPAEQALP
ncbi:MAG: UDP-2,3-diacylglucosamine diphosphatase [Planctomycetes bacterium]|nr:UDP-2,3-diacylglucosamine diphosphatase [Planctomycetota bacterium]